MSKKTKKDAFLQAYTDSKGIISYACESVGISRPTYYRWRQEDEDFNEKCSSIEEYVIDLVEGKLLTNINEGDVTSIIFYLKTKGKRRGYVERVQTEDISDREPVKVEIVMPNRSDEDEDTSNH